MTPPQASGTFEIDSWNEDTYDEGPTAKLGRTRLTKTFHGHLSGTSVVNLIGGQRPGRHRRVPGGYTL